MHQYVLELANNEFLLFVILRKDLDRSPRILSSSRETTRVIMLEVVLSQRVLVKGECGW